MFIRGADMRANRLFDPKKEFEGKVGVAYGGPELSERNLRCLEAGVQVFRRSGVRTRNPERLIPISATGDILTGRTAVLYALRGATSCQMHTLFQLPDPEFASRVRNKSAAVLHHLIFHPESGLLVWLERLRIAAGHATIRWMDLPGLGAE